MTNQKPIDQLTPDELNAAVAVEVMDYQSYRGHNGSAYWSTPSGIMFKSSFDPSTNIATAFVVVEKMRNLGFDFSLSSSVHDGDGKEWWAEFSITTSPLNREQGTEAGSHCLAITRAALAAVRADNNKEKKPNE